MIVLLMQGVSELVQENLQETFSVDGLADQLGGDLQINTAASSGLGEVVSKLAPVAQLVVRHLYPLLKNKFKILVSFMQARRDD